MEGEKVEGNEVGSQNTGFIGVRTLFMEISTVPRIMSSTE